MSKSIRQRSYSYLVPKLYDTISENFKNIDNIILFKSHLKKHLLQPGRALTFFFENSSISIFRAQYIPIIKLYLPDA